MINEFIIKNYIVITQGEFHKMLSLLGFIFRVVNDLISRARVPIL